MTFPRRNLLRLGGLGLALGIGGCVYNGPFSSADLSLSIREPFDAAAPVTVPLAVSARVQSVDTKVAALHGVEVVALDEDRSVMASQTLGDLAWRDAPESQRSSEEHEVGFGSTATAYEAEWSPELTLSTSAVPTALTFALTGVSLGRDDTGGGTAGSNTPASLVAPAAASQPPPPLEVRARRLRRDGSLSATVGSEAYARREIEPRVRTLDGEPLVPEPPATDTERRNRTDTNRPGRGATPNRTVSSSTRGRTGTEDPVTDTSTEGVAGRSPAETEETGEISGTAESEPAGTSVDEGNSIRTE
ncbi:hypothetical protein [Halosimplex sp. J119]